MRFRVVLVPFPFDDLSGQKVRPAVCLTEAVGTYRQVVLAFITSTVPTTLEPTDILLTPGTPDFAPTGLRVRSTLCLHRMVTVSTSIIRRQMGVLTPSIQAQVQERLRVSLLYEQCRQLNLRANYALQRNGRDCFCGYFLRRVRPEGSLFHL